MKLSAKTEYACIAVLELANRFDSGQVAKIRDIADRHGIPSRFLVQILLQLKGAGLVTSTRGASGGYRLAVSPESITLFDVISVVEGCAQEITSNTDVESPYSQVVIRSWQAIADLQIEQFQASTFADLMTGVRNLDENMYYI